MFPQLVLSGLAAGSIYALIALAMVVIYRASGVPNFAQGEMGMVSTFVAYTLLAQYDLPFFPSFLIALIFAFLLGWSFEFMVIRRAKHPDQLNLMVLTLGFQLVLFGLVSWRWGADPRRFSFPISDDVPIRLGPAVIGQLSAVTALLGVILPALLWALYRFSTLGLAMKATQQNETAARINGIRTERVVGLTFGLSSVIGALAAMLVAPVVTLDPTLMWDPLMKGFAAAVLGGMSSLAGPVVGGYLLGILENLFGGYVSVEFKSVIAFFVIVLVVLYLRPSGLLARHYEKRV